MIGGLKYFIGNWKMFGIPSSFQIIDKINTFYNRDRNNNKNYRIIIAPPFTLLQYFSQKTKNKKVNLCAQNCYSKDYFGAHTGSVSPFMIRKIGIKYIILGHSENRASGEDDKIISKKLSLALDNNFTVIYCIGENKKEKKNNKTLSVLKKQITNVLKSSYNFKKIIIAYEPLWSIGSGKVPSTIDLKRNISFLKKYTKQKFKLKFYPRILYGGSVDKQSIKEFSSIREVDGFLIGGASKSSKNFIDIIKNFYK